MGDMRLEAIKPVGGVTIEEAPRPAAAPARSGKKFLTGTPGLGKFGGNAAQALGRSVAFLARQAYDPAGMALLRNARVTNLEALANNRVEFIKTLSNLAGQEPEALA